MTSAPVPVITAVPGAPWESRLVTAIEQPDSGLIVVRRCVDVADVLAVAATGQARAVLLSTELRHLDREALDRLRADHVAVVGVVGPRDLDAERQLRDLGVTAVVAVGAEVGELGAAVRQEVTALSHPGPAGPHAMPPSFRGSPNPHSTGLATSDQSGQPDDRSAEWEDAPEHAGLAALFGGPLAGEWIEHAEPPARAASPADGPGPTGLPGRPGRLVAVWGPTGAPGRTTVAVGLASELAALGMPTLLADADTYGGAVAQVLGLLDESPGLAAAARAANAGQLDLAALAVHARQVLPRLRVLSGLLRADRWPELRSGALQTVWALSRQLAEVTVVDCGFCLEQDEEITFDTVAPQRNAATLTTLEAADVIVAVGSAEPIGLQRLIRGLAELAEVVPGRAPLVVINRVRRSAVGPHPEQQINEALSRYAAVSEPVFLPYDRPALDRALLAGLTLAESAPESAVRKAVADLAARVSGERQSGRHRGRGNRLRRRTRQPSNA